MQCDNSTNLKRHKKLMKNSGIKRVKSFLPQDEVSNTNSFIEGVVKRVNEMCQQSIPVIDLLAIKERINKKKSDEILEVINMVDENKIISLSEDEEDIQVISDKEFLENVMTNGLQNSNEKKYQEESAFTCLICYKTKILINTRVFDCGHEFCDKCAGKWMKMSATCPVCRKKLSNW